MMEWCRMHTTYRLFLVLLFIQAAAPNDTSTSTNISVETTTFTSTKSETATEKQTTSSIVTTPTTVTSTTQRPDINGSCVNNSNCQWMNNTECRFNTCQCAVNYFDLNKTTCLSVSELEPKREVIGGGETYLLLTWNPYTEPLKDLFNSSILNLVVTVYGFPDLPETNRSECILYKENCANCSNLTQGGLYTVTFSVFRSGKLLHNTSFSNSTKPAQPGALIKHDFNAPNITLEWNASKGLVDNYTVSVTEVEGLPTQILATSDNFTKIQVTGLRHGRKHNVTIVANRFDKKSASSMDVFNTVVTEPDPPTHVVVQQDSVTNNSMNISWKEPGDFNGPRQGYTICVKETIYFNETWNDKGCHNLSTEFFLAQNLTAGAFYQFFVYSINSEYNSNITATSEDKQTREGTPGVVIDMKLVPFENNIEAMWQRPSDPYGNITAYRIQALNYANSSDCHILWLKTNETQINTTEESSKCELHPKQEIEMNEENMSVNITEVKPYSNYSITVWAYTNVGAGIPNSNMTITIETVPGNVTNVTGKPINSTAIVVSWHAPPIRTGRTQYHIEVHDIIAGDLKEIINIPGYDVQNFTVQNLQEYWIYQFAVFASTSKGNSSHVYSDNITTPEASPGAAVEPKIYFHKNNSYCDATKVTFGWREPELEDRNGKIVKYNISLTVIKLGHEATNYTKLIENPDPYSKVSQTWTTAMNTKPEQQYTVEVWAITDTGLKGKRENTSFSSITCKPSSYTGSKDLIPEPEKSTSSLTVTLYLNFFRNDEQGKVVSYGLVVSDKNLTNVELETISDFEQGKPNNFPYKFYLTTLQNAVEDKGKENATHPIENLPENTPLYLSMFVCTSAGCTPSKYYGPYRTLKSPEPPSNAATIAVAIILVLLAIVAVVGGVVLYRKGYHTRILATMRKHSRDQQDSVAFNHITEDTEHIARKRPFKLSNLEEYLEGLNKDSKLGFAKEYEDIQRLSPRHSTEAALLGENKSKNRWVNILAFDHSRVKLQLLDEDDPTSDYINANFIPDLKHQRAYIATQGPLPGTIDDFWRMVWEHKVTVIVMLTKCKEGNRVKCEMYWPNELHEARQYGNIIVSPVSISNMDKFDINVFDVTMNEEIRRVMHFHFQEFPDFSADVDFLTFVNFVKTVRQHIPCKIHGPIVVHCSAGVGRTGTYITVDCLHQLLNSPDFHFNEDVDIFDYVLTMRDNRTLMVQVEQQYIMIHECLRILLEQSKQKEEGVEEHLYENQAFAPTRHTTQMKEDKGSNCSPTSSLTCPLIVSNNDPDTDEEADKLYENASSFPRTEL